MHSKSKGREKGTQISARIRPELNIEKWPAMWKPSHSPSPASVRVLDREHTTGDGTRVRARVEIGFTHLGELTTEDQRTYYALVKQWELNGRSPDQTFFSVRGLSRLLRKRWGTNVITAVTGSLRRLRATPVTWENAYFDGARRETLEEINTFSILSELKIVRRKVDGVVSKEAGYFRFNDFTLKNLLNHHTKPVLFETILGFKTDLAQILYTHLDLILADKRAYERRTRDLFTDLGLRGSEYDLPYERKRALSNAIAELRGALLTTGVIAGIALEKTKDAKDYKLTVAKGAGRFNESAHHEPAPSDKAASAVAGRTATEAEDLVRHFHKVFHGVTPSFSQSKELSHATTLIAQHGFDRAKYVVDFSLSAASKTRYLPQTLGGILQYTSRAVAAYEESARRNAATARARAEIADRQAFDALQAEAEEKRRRDAEERLRALPPAEYDALYAKAKDNLMSRSRWLLGKDKPQFFERLVRTTMIADLMVQAREQEHQRTDL